VTAIAAICAQLDGLPPAIELKAARIRLFSPGTLLARLDKRLPLLFDGAHDLPARQWTLTDILAWSYEQLHEDERTPFRQLAVFVGGFTVEAAEAVCNRNSDGQHESSRHSLLQWVETVGGVSRFRLLDTIRESALLQLEANDELVACRQTHAASFLELARLGETSLLEDRSGWLDGLELERDNFASCCRVHTRPPRQRHDRASLASPAALDGEHRHVTILGCEVLHRSNMDSRRGSPNSAASVESLLQLAEPTIDLYKGTIIE